MEWFVAQMQQSPDWTRRLVRLSQVFDSSGMSYFNFVADKLKRAWMAGLLQRNHMPVFIDTMHEYDEHGRTRLLKYLERAYHPSGEEVLVLKNVKILVSMGANVNGRSRDGSTALIVAAKR